MDFKEKLQILRTQMKISQEELAAQLNISRQSVTKWENGQSFPDMQRKITHTRTRTWEMKILQKKKLFG